ncbi:FadR/GntR family transcriptional regulator [Bartonella sp. LJL80]
MNTSRLYQTIVSKIKRDIETGHYQIGDKLPAERDLAEILKVSRTSVREAIIALEVSGLVEVKVGSGVYIKSGMTLHGPDLHPQIHPLLKPYLKDDEEIAPFELLEARLHLEPHLAEMAATERTDAQMAEIKQAYLMNVSDNLEQSKDHIGDRLFHIRIAESAQNAAYAFFLKYLLGQQYTEVFSGLQKLYTPDDMPLRSQVEHHQILIAIEKKQPEAARIAMQNHIQNVINIFSRRME